MPFWKKSEDPWDVEPEKRRPVPAENEEKGPGLLDQFQDWNEARKAEKARRETPPPPIPCPWCGKTMETGYLMGNRGIWWAPGRPDAWAKWVSVAAAEGAFQVDTEGGLATYRTAWHCPDCGNMAVINVAVRNHMDQLTHLQAGNLGQHMGQHRILHHVPVVGREHILGSLVQDGV